jgi:hypothetical protein
MLDRLTIRELEDEVEWLYSIIHKLQDQLALAEEQVAIIDDAQLPLPLSDEAILAKAEFYFGKF